MHKIPRFSLLAMALGVALAGSVAAAPMSAVEAEDLLEQNGMTDVSPLEYKGGMWYATAINADGEPVDVRVDPIARKATWNTGTSSRTTTTTTTRTTGDEPMRLARRDQPVVVEQIIVEPPMVRSPIIVRERVIVPAGGRISKDNVRTVLTLSGYHDIHDIDWLSNRGVWKAEARDATGDDREIHVDPVDGRILHVEDD